MINIVNDQTILNFEKYKLQKYRLTRLVGDPCPMLTIGSFIISEFVNI